MSIEPEKEIIKISYIPHFDTLRAMAIIMTILAHYGGVPYMHLGVDLFFALSGFLITAILLKDKQANFSRLQIVKNFFIRRVLRLFPAYYIYLIFFALLSIFTSFYVGDQSLFLYHLSYTTNFLLYFRFDEVYLSIFGHLWSLSVEEQFYLIWPWLILIVPFKAIKATLFSVVLLGLASHGIFSEGDGIYAGIRFMPIGNFHTLGIGALLAYFWYYKNDSKLFQFFQTGSNISLLVSLILFLTLLYFTPSDAYKSVLVKVLRQLGLITVIFLLLLKTLKGWQGFIGKLFTIQWIQQIGKISYGIYLFHMPIPYLLFLFMTKFNLAFLKPYIPFLACIFTYLIATLSYNYLEKPFLKLKRYFN